MSALLRRLARSAFRRGMGGGARDWLTVAAVSGLLGWARQRSKAPPKVVHREVMGPGESISISVYEPPK
jgi:hypothetical protein